MYLRGGSASLCCASFNRQSYNHCLIELPCPLLRLAFQASHSVSQIHIFVFHHTEHAQAVSRFDITSSSPCMSTTYAVQDYAPSASCLFMSTIALPTRAAHQSQSQQCGSSTGHSSSRGSSAAAPKAVRSGQRRNWRCGMSLTPDLCVSSLIAGSS